MQFMASFGMAFRERRHRFRFGPAHGGDPHRIQGHREVGAGNGLHRAQVNGDQQGLADPHQPIALVEFHLWGGEADPRQGSGSGPIGAQQTDGFRGGHDRALEGLPPGIGGPTPPGPRGLLKARFAQALAELALPRGNGRLGAGELIAKLQSTRPLEVQIGLHIHATA